MGFIKINKTLYLLVVFIFLSLFFKLDYRYINNLTCCGDDFDYYSHAVSIAIDKDFDYSNQLSPSDSAFFVDGKVAPLGFFGAGLMASPFLLLGSYLDLFIDNSITSNSLIVYSLASLFYLFLSVLLIHKAMKLLNKKISFIFLATSLLGSGLGYYAFERYSMTHVYEAFSVSLIFYSVVNIKLDRKNLLNSFLLVFGIFVGISVRYTNYHLFIIPLIFEKLFFKNKGALNIYSSKIVLTFGLLFSYIFYIINLGIYGKFYLNPLKIYYSDSYRLTSYFENMDNLNEFTILNIINLYKIFFSQEFGIFWFSPAIFAGSLIVVAICVSKKIKLSIKVALVIVFAYNFGIVTVWSSTASSYGFRYLFSLIPFSLIILLSYEGEKLFKMFFNYVYIFSLFGLLSILFFESTPTTELSTFQVINTFGQQDTYSNPYYLSGLVNSITEPTAYMKIFVTSFLFLLLFKLTSMFYDVDTLVLDGKYSISPAKYEKLEETLDIYSQVDSIQVIIIFSFLFFITIVSCKFIYKDN